MDPLSVTASIIALVQAAGAVAKGVKFLRSLKDVPQNITDLLKELELAQAIAEQVKGALDEVKTLGASGATAPTGTQSDVLGMVEEQAKSLEKAAGDLNSLYSSFAQTAASAPPTPQISSGKKVGEKRQRVRQISQWLLKSHSIQPIRARIDAARKHLTLCFDVIHMVLLARQAEASQQVQQGMHMVIAGITEIRTDSQSTRTGMASVEDALSQHTAMMAEVMRSLQVQTVPRQQLTGVQDVAADTASCSESPPQQQQSAPSLAEAIAPYDSRAGEASEPPRTAESTYIVHTILRRTMCLPTCKCQCHRAAYLDKRYRRASSIFGSLFIEYNNLPILDPRPCNVQSCIGQSRSLKVHYAFPSWLMERAVSLAASWGSLTGDGCSLHLNVPRVMSPDVEKAFDMATLPGNVSWYKFAISHKLISPNSVTSDGVGLIAAAHNNAAWFLIEQGFSMTVGTVHAGNSKRWSLSYSASNETAALARCIDAVAPIQSPLIFDILWGIQDVPLSYALQQAPWEVNSRNDFGNTPMHVAIGKHDVDSLKAMLKAPGCDINAADGIGRSLLHWAARRDLDGCTEMTRLLLDAGADVNSPSGRGTPIFSAMRNSAVVRLLLDHGAQLVAETDEGVSNPLLYDTYHGADELLQSAALLVDAGLDLAMKNRYGETALIVAIYCKKAKLPEWLIERGARVDAVDNYGLNILHWTAEGLACHSEGDQAAKYCIPVSKLKGLNPDAKNAYGKTPMGVLVSRRIRVDADVEEWFRTLLEDIRAVNKEAGITFSSVEELEEADEDEEDEDEEDEDEEDEEDEDEEDEEDDVFYDATEQL